MYLESRDDKLCLFEIYGGEIVDNDIRVEDDFLKKSHLFCIDDLADSSWHLVGAVGDRGSDYTVGIVRVQVIVPELGD